MNRPKYYLEPGHLLTVDTHGTALILFTGCFYLTSFTSGEKLEVSTLNQNPSTTVSAKGAQKIATRVSLVSVVGNIILTAFKFFAGIFAHSQVMISDAVHSASDVISSLIVIVGVKISGRDADDDHPYGHERFECVAAVILAAILVIVGGSIGIKAVKSIIDGSYREMVLPGMLALIASIVSIVAKFAMFLYTQIHAKRINSTALKAEAWHHLSDSLSSVGALIGIAGARLGAPILEPVASIVICLLILKAAFDIFRSAIDQMVDKSCSAETEQKIRDCVMQQKGVICVDMLQTRMFGNRIYVDVEIGVDKSLTIEEGHEIAEQVHNALELNFASVKHVMVHVNPAG